MTNSRILQGRATRLALALFLLAGGSLTAQEPAEEKTTEKTMMIMGTGGNEIPVEVDTLTLDSLQVKTAGGKTVTVPGTYTLPKVVYESLSTATTTGELKVKELGGRDGDKVVLFTVRKDKNVDQTLQVFEPCDSFELTDGEEENVRPANIFCDKQGYLVRGGLVTILDEEGNYNVLAKIPPRRGLVTGTDLGVALTIMKTNDSHKGYEFFEGATGYYSLTRLKTSSLRLVANLSSLDMDPKKDFETGLGLGLLLRTPYNANNDDRMGFGILIGGGYNFMLDSRRDEDGNEAEPWYWFVGFSWNFNRAASNTDPANP